LTTSAKGMGFELPVFDPEVAQLCKRTQGMQKIARAFKGTLNAQRLGSAAMPSTEIDAAFIFSRADFVDVFEE